jgi:hypothetical protein
MEIDAANPEQYNGLKKRRPGWKDLYLLLPLVFLILMVLYFPFRERFEFDPDEGVEAMKALLLARGYSMYSDIWSDHPPLSPGGLRSGKYGHRHRCTLSIDAARFRPAARLCYAWRPCPLG